MHIKTKLRILGLVCLIGLGAILVVTVIGLGSIREAEGASHRRQSYVIDLLEIKSSALSSIMLDPTLPETRDVFAAAEKNIDLHAAAATGAIKRDDVKQELKAILAQWSHYDQQSQAIIGLAAKDLKAANDKLVPLYDNEFKPFQAALEKFVGARQLDADQAKSRANSISDRTFRFIVILIGFVTAIIVIAVLNISRSLQKNLLEMQQKLELLRRGDLTERLPANSGDELGEIAGSVNTFIEALQHLVQRTREQSVEVTDAAMHLASASAQVLSSSNHQSEATSSVSAAIEQLSVSIDHVSGSALAAEKTARLSEDRSREAGVEVADAVDEIRRIEHVVSEASGQIESLGIRAREISGIVNAIKEVADQTNLLALNAAIEAARAGEQGRGFAVVADEVRKLAERTAQSAQEITGMISSIQTEAENSTSIVRKGNELVAQGVRKAELAGGAMHQIEEGSAGVLGAISDISSVLSEQRTSSNEIAKNVELIASMTEESAAAIAEVSNAAESLKKLAVELQQGVAQFRV